MKWAVPHGAFYHPLLLLPHGSQASTGILYLPRVSLGPLALRTLRTPSDPQDPISQAIGLPVPRRRIMVTLRLFRYWRMIPNDRKCTTSREPAPTNYARVSIGDVGFIRRGQFHLLFSAGSPLAERQPREDLPTTFEPLVVGNLTRGQPRMPGCLRTQTVKEVGAGLGATLPTGTCVLSIISLFTYLKMRRLAP